MPKRKSRAVIDTNLWISFLIGKRALQLESVLVNHPVTIIYSDELLNEIQAVLKRRKFRKYFSEDSLEIVDDILKTIGEKIIVTSELAICRDKKDNFLLSLCHDSEADFLITGDDDLLALKRIGTTKIVSLKEFVELYS